MWARHGAGAQLVGGGGGHGGAALVGQLAAGRRLGS